MYVGYARVSTMEQNEARQLNALQEHGCERVFLDKLSGKDTNRPELQALLNFVREGDTVIVSEYSRLARSTGDLFSLIRQLTDKGVQVRSLKENFDTSTPQGKLMLTIFAGLAEFERELTLQRQREGIAIAKEQGKYHGRQPIPYDEEKFHQECSRWIRGEQTAAVTMRTLGMKPNRFYRIAQKLGYQKIDGKWVRK